MLHIEKHNSYEVPPSVPYFGKSRPALQDKSNLQQPTSRVNVRSECIDQLSKLYGLLEKNIITKEEYDKVQQTILKDMHDT